MRDAPPHRKRGQNVSEHTDQYGEVQTADSEKMADAERFEILLDRLGKLSFIGDEKRLDHTSAVSAELFGDDFCDRLTG